MRYLESTSNEHTLSFQDAGLAESLWPALQLAQSFAESWYPGPVPHAGTAHALALEVFDSREHRHP
jgi:hypothetical protein